MKFFFVISLSEHDMRRRKKNILVICPGFSSDCVETLEEISIQGKESFVRSGGKNFEMIPCCLLYTSPSPRDRQKSRMPSSA